MELILSQATAAPVVAKTESVEPEWVDVLERLPEDGERVHVILQSSREIRVAWRGPYQHTGAWFDAATRHPIYEAITRWKARS